MNDFFEKTLENIVFENIKSMEEKGLTVFYKNTRRQFYTPSKKIIDLFTWEISDNILYARIIELKREAVRDSAYWQILEYYTDWIYNLRYGFSDINFEIVLIGTEVSENILSAMMISNVLRVFLYKYSVSGIIFTEVGKSFDRVKNNTKEFPDENCKPMVEWLINLGD